jgi:hypothetical protein
MARRVGLKYVTEFMMVKNWSSSLQVRVSTGTSSKDFKNLRSWILNFTKNTKIRKVLARKVLPFSKCLEKHFYFKMKLFRVCAESSTLYNAGTWTITDTLPIAFSSNLE